MAAPIYVYDESTGVQAESDWELFENKILACFKEVVLLGAELGQYRAAQSILGVLEENRPHWTSLVLLRGLILMRQGLVHEAIDAVKDLAHSRDEHHENAKLLLALAMKLVGKTAASESLLTGLNQDLPGKDIGGCVREIRELEVTISP